MKSQPSHLWTGRFGRLTELFLPEKGIGPVCENTVLHQLAGQAQIVEAAGREKAADVVEQLAR